jgi:hypothetical protein
MSKWEEIHARAVKRFDAIWLVQMKERAECLHDRRFLTIRGAQWDDSWGPDDDTAPKIEVNKTHKEYVRVLSDYRNNRVSVDFRPDDDATDDETADALDGLYRADFEECGQEAQDNAFEEGVGGGMGSWRLRACYEDEGDPDNDYQRIAFDPITDADQFVFFDGDAKRQDKADAKFALVLNPMSEEAFHEAYGDVAETDFADWPRTGMTFDWHPADKVYVGEYYEVEQAKSKKIILIHPVIEEEKVLFDPEQDELDELEAQGWTISATRAIKKPKVKKYTLSGGEVLAEETIPGPNIPIIPFYAKRWVVDNIERCAGHTRYAKDPQMVYNMQVSQLTEIASITPFEKPIFDPAQMSGLETQWAEGNKKRHAYALAKALRNPDGSVAALGPIGKIEPPSVPPAAAALIQLTGQDIADILGSSDQTENVPANTSAQAIQLVHNRADQKTFIYLDNFAKAVKRAGEVWLGMNAALRVEDGRKLRTVDDQGGQEYITIAEPGLNKQGLQILRNDYQNGKFRVLVDVGPSSQSRRDATVNAMLGVANIAGQAGDQQLAGACITAAISQMDGEGLSGLKKFARMRAVQAGVEEPTEEEKQEMAQAAQNQQPDPNSQLVAAKVQDLQASAAEKKSGAILKVAQAHALGGPAEAPAVPDGLEAVHKAVQIRKDLATATNLETKTAHMPLELSIEAKNAETNRVKAHKQSRPAQ